MPHWYIYIYIHNIYIIYYIYNIYIIYPYSFWLNYQQSDIPNYLLCGACSARLAGLTMEAQGLQAQPWKPFSLKLMLSQFHRFLFLVGGHFQNVFSQKAAGPAATSFGVNPRTHSEAQGPLGDDVTFQECRKSWKFSFYSFVRPDPARAGPKKLRTICPLISVLSEPPQLPYEAKCIHQNPKESIRIKRNPL